MNLFKCDNIVSLFKVICWTICVIVAFYWTYLYNLNEDLSIVDNRKFYQDPSDVFPVLSICFKNPFPEANLEKMGDEINPTTYVEYLQGNFNDSKFQSIDYQSSVLKVSEYVNEVYIKWKNGSYKSYYTEDYLNKTFYTTYAGFGFFQERFYQCYGMDIPHEKDIQIYSILLRNKVFLSNYTPKNYDFLTFLHYPNQLLRSVGSMKYKWEERTPHASIDISFRIKDIEVIRRRNKRHLPCNEDWNNHDDSILVNHVNEIGCRPPYLFPSKLSKICLTADEMRRARFNLRSDEYGTYPPCLSMDKIMFTYEEHDLSGFGWSKPGHTWIGMNLFIDHFKKIEHTR